MSTPSLKIGYMPRVPNVAKSLDIVSHAKQGLSYSAMWACCPFLKRLARLSGSWRMHHWNTRALPFTVATLSSVLRFLTNSNICTQSLHIECVQDNMLI